jgi:hypothetical protein
MPRVQLMSAVGGRSSPEVDAAAATVTLSGRRRSRQKGTVCVGLPDHTPGHLEFCVLGVHVRAELGECVSPVPFFGIQL